MVDDVGPIGKESGELVADDLHLTEHEVTVVFHDSAGVFQAWP